MTTKSMETINSLLDLGRDGQNSELWWNVRNDLSGKQAIKQVSQKMWSHNHQPDTAESSRVSELMSESGLLFGMKTIIALVYNDLEMQQMKVSTDEIAAVDQEYETVRVKFLG